MPLVDLFHKGLPPTSGGVLQQPAWFVKFARQIEREENTILESIRNGHNN